MEAKKINNPPAGIPGTPPATNVAEVSNHNQEPTISAKPTPTVPEWLDAANMTESQRYDDPGDYVHVCCDYYRITQRPDCRGHLTRCLTPWKFSQLKVDFGDNISALRAIPRFDGIGCFPCNTDKYEYSVHRYFNTYEKLSWIPSPGPWPNIEHMLRHIFGEQFKFGLDYFQLLYMKPEQNLPILILVSIARNTGKTTFLNFMKEIYGGNMVYITNETFRSHFNADRAGKLIVACDEALLDKKEDSEKLKALSTAEKTFVEYKGKDRYEIDNYAKYIFCSNNTAAPIYIDRAETRYWVREVSTLESCNPDFMTAMKKEIPAFLHFLCNRQMHVPAAVSRMWFDPLELDTPAQEHIKRACRPTEEIELAEFLLDVMDDFCRDTLQYTAGDLGNLLAFYHKSIRHYHHIISKEWRLPKAASKMAYDLFSEYVGPENRHRYGRYYTFTRDFLEGLIPLVPPRAAKPAAPEPEPTIF